MIERLTLETIPGAVALQAACFPPPFDPELLWKAEHLERHFALFPEGQFVAVVDGVVVGSASSVRISEAHWRAHHPWEIAVGGHLLEAYDPSGSTLYGVDISVHPAYRGRGIARALYQARLQFVKENALKRYGTACRIPDWQTYAQAHPAATKIEYVQAVQRGDATDRTLTPLLRMGLTLLDVLENYMEDEESGDAAALLEWTP